MGRFWVIGTTLLVAALAAPLSALAGYGNPTPPPGSGPASNDRSVDAAGNPFSGGLAFDPAHIKAKVGQTVSWTNTDNVVPHTATEDHRLWRLSGDYGPPGTMGFGPGETVKRRFAAGTWHYFCEIHPTEMRGVVDVPVTLRKSVGTRPGRFTVTATWSKTQLPPGQVFDVQEKIGGGAYRTVRDGVRSLQGSFAARSGQLLSFRARVREKADASASSGYSPKATVRLG
jgi:plastocyanin